MPRDIGQITPYVLLEQEDWFETEIRFVRRLQPGMQAVDVGANHGVYTLAMAAAAGPTGRVWAFEPTPATGDLLQQSLDLGGFSHAGLLRTALSDRSGTARFNVGKQSELNAIARDESGPGSIEVKVATLDGVSLDLGWRGIDFIKIDAEGHDRNVLLGGKSFFERESPLVMFEIASSTEKDVGLAQLLVAQGYRIFFVFGPADAGAVRPAREAGALPAQSFRWKSIAPNLSWTPVCSRFRLRGRPRRSRRTALPWPWNASRRHTGRRGRIRSSGWASCNRHLPARCRLSMNPKACRIL